MNVLGARVSERTAITSKWRIFLTFTDNWEFLEMPQSTLLIGLIFLSQARTLLFQESSLTLITGYATLGSQAFAIIGEESFTLLLRNFAPLFFA